jgi:16S rRNA (guanine(966)-N(2))-methyltransferase RsmD
MRIIAGEFRSRRLRSLPGLRTRPTSDRLRESLFNILSAGEPATLSGSIWLDLFAGTGAVGIEALSRGAAMVYFVESSAQARELIAANLAPLALSSRCEILEQTVEKAIPALERRNVLPDFIFLDPPYVEHIVYRRALAALGSSSLSSKALVIVEHEKRFDPGEEFRVLRRMRQVREGDTVLSFYRRKKGSEVDREA